MLSGDFTRLKAGSESEERESLVISANDANYFRTLQRHDESLRRTVSPIVRPSVTD